MERYFINVDGGLFMFNDINRRVVNKKFIVFTQEEIDKCFTLQDLMKFKKFQEITVEEYNESLGNIVVNREVDRTPDKESYRVIAEQLSPDRNVSIDPRRVDAEIKKYPSNFIKEAANNSIFIEDREESKSQKQEMKSTTSSASFGEATQAKPKKREVWWCGPAQDAGGYGKMNRECIERLYKKGAKVQLFQPDNLLPDFRSTVKATSSLKEMLGNVVSEDAPSVWGVMPPVYFPRNSKKILFTMMETATLPKSFANKCNQANEIWLPSNSNMDMFKKSQEDGDLDKNISLVHMPLGANTDLYKPFIPTDEQKSLFNIKTKGFVFLSLFGWSLRKGVDVLFKAYLQEFTKEDDVTLLIVSRKDGCASPEKNKEIRDQIKEYISRWSSLENHPHIVHIGEAIPEEQLPILYNMSNCHALVSRGEGFALTLLESGSCEVPCIATRCGGQLDFLNDDNSELIDIEGYGPGSQEIKCISSYYESAPFAVLGEKATNQLKERMRYVTNNYSEAKSKAKLLRENIVQNFTWDILADKVEKQLFG